MSKNSSIAKPHKGSEALWVLVFGKVEALAAFPIGKPPESCVQIDNVPTWDPHGSHCGSSDICPFHHIMQADCIGFAFQISLLLPASGVFAFGNGVMISLFGNQQFIFN